jgi:hypothetical protein
VWGARTNGARATGTEYLTRGLWTASSRAKNTPRKLYRVGEEGVHSAHTAMNKMMRDAGTAPRWCEPALRSVRLVSVRPSCWGVASNGYVEERFRLSPKSPQSSQITGTHCGRIAPASGGIALRCRVSDPVSCLKSAPGESLSTGDEDGGNVRERCFRIWLPSRLAIMPIVEK